jgi:hypothetical protein
VRRLARHRHRHGETAGALGQKVSRVALGDAEIDVDRVELDDGGEQRVLEKPLPASPSVAVIL